MTHESSHVIIKRVREFIAAHPLSVTGGLSLIGAVLGALVF